jgi:HEAT repeat protein
LALAAIGPAARQAGPAIAEAAEGYGNVRVSAGYASGRLGVHTEVALHALARALEGDNRELRERAARYLGNLGDAATPVLEKAPRDPEGSVRTEAAAALRRVRARDVE